MTPRRVLLAALIVLAAAWLWVDAADYRRRLPAAAPAAESPGVSDAYRRSAERRQEALEACIALRGESDPCGCRGRAEEYLRFYRSGALAEFARLLETGC